jgi:hypothetical protein
MEAYDETYLSSLNLELWNIVCVGFDDLEDFGNLTPRDRWKGLDVAWGGVNRWICKLIKIQPTVSTETSQTGFPN